MTHHEADIEKLRNTINDLILKFEGIDAEKDTLNTIMYAVTQYGDTRERAALKSLLEFIYDKERPAKFIDDEISDRLAELEGKG